MAVIPTTSSRLELSISVAGCFDYSSSSGTNWNCVAVRDLDMNRAAEEDDEWMIGSVELDEDESNGGGGGGNENRPKKLRLTTEQSHLLEQSFSLNHTLNPKQKESLAEELKLKPRQVEVWFQNRRARSKLKQTEMECEHLKRWFGLLTEENKRLHKEVEELRAMKVAPPTVISPHSCEPLPAANLTMCPRCERVTTTTLDNARIIV